MSSRSVLVNVSVAKLTIVRSGTPSSGGEIDAVTLLAHNPHPSDAQIRDAFGD